MLKKSAQRGVYTPGQVVAIDDPALAGWLVEAPLHGSRVESLGLRTVGRLPALFPFDLQVPPRLSERLFVFRQGLDDDRIVWA